MDLYAYVIWIHEQTKILTLLFEKDNEILHKYHIKQAFSCSACGLLWRESLVYNIYEKKIELNSFEEISTNFEKS